MHKSALALAKAFHDAHVAPLIERATAERPLVIGEFGSMDVNGSIRPIFECAREDAALAFEHAQALLGTPARREKAPAYRRDPRVRYVGFDIAPGKGVDLVIGERCDLWLHEIGGKALDASEPGHRCFGPRDPWVDVWLSCSTLEHVRSMAYACQRMGESLKPGGLAWWCAPWRWPYHGFPLDCWRILPDGMRVLLEHAGLEPIACEFNPQGDCIGIGRKPA